MLRLINLEIIKYFLSVGNGIETAKHNPMIGYLHFTCKVRGMRHSCAWPRCPAPSHWPLSIGIGIQGRCHIRVITVCHSPGIHILSNPKWRTNSCVNCTQCPDWESNLGRRIYYTRNPTHLSSQFGRG